MTYERREEIFSKEVITLSEMEELLSLSKPASSSKMTEMKRQVGDRLGINGRIHVEDYFAWLRRNGTEVMEERYFRPKDEPPIVRQKYEHRAFPWLPEK